MFGLFKKKSEQEILEKKYKKLMSQWHELSTVNRSESDKKYAEAEEVLKKLETLKNQ